MTNEELSAALQCEGYSVPALAIKLFPVRERERIEKWLNYIHRPVVSEGRPAQRPEILERYEND